MELNKENLYSEYIINNKTQKECSKIFNCSKWTIIRTLSKFNIRKTNDYIHKLDNKTFNDKVQKVLGNEYVCVSDYSGSHNKVDIKHLLCGRIHNVRAGTINFGARGIECPYCKKQAKKAISKDLLIKYYLVDNLNATEIADKIGVDKSTICRFIKKIEIEKDDSQKEEINKRRIDKLKESKTIYTFDKNEIIMYLKEGFTIKEISSIYNTSMSTIGLFILNNNLLIYRDEDEFKNNKKQKLRDTFISRYGVENPMGIEEFRKKAFENKSKIHISKPEKELFKYIQSIYDGEITRYHDGFYELDIYIPDKKVGIEYNGNYWHSLEYKTKTYHYDKNVYFENKGIRVIHIWEYEWNNERQNPILKNIINNALGLNIQKIYARKCNIEIRESKNMKNFFNKNNIQGFRGGKFAICLVYEGEVVMSYIMGHCYFGKGKYDWEVIRGATKLGVNVIGGASKIWKYFLKEYDPTNCVYYIDYNYFNGNSLPHLGLTYIKTQPGFKNYWKDTKQVKNREPKRHKEISKLYETGKVIPIYNAGTKVYVWEKV